MRPVWPQSQALTVYTIIYQKYHDTGIEPLSNAHSHRQTDGTDITNHQILAAPLRMESHLLPLMTWTLSPIWKLTVTPGFTWKCTTCCCDGQPGFDPEDAAADPALLPEGYRDICCWGSNPGPKWKVAAVTLDPAGDGAPPTTDELARLEAGYDQWWW